jgi:hypothetical protein
LRASEPSERNAREAGGSTALLPQPHAGRVASGELDARLFEHALDRSEIVMIGHAAAFLAIDDHVARHRSALGQHGLISFICQIGAAGIGLA